MQRVTWTLATVVVLLGYAVVAYAQNAIKLTAFSSCSPITNVAMSTASETVFAANTARKSATITNNDASIAIHVAMATTATTAWSRVAAGQAWVLEPVEGRIYQGIITVIAASGTPAISGDECI